MLNPDEFVSPQKQQELARECARIPFTALRSAMLIAIEADNSISYERMRLFRDNPWTMVDRDRFRDLMMEAKFGKPALAIREAIVAALLTLRGETPCSSASGCAQVLAQTDDPEAHAGAHPGNANGLLSFAA